VGILTSYNQIDPVSGIALLFFSFAAFYNKNKALLTLQRKHLLRHIKTLHLQQTPGLLVRKRLIDSSLKFAERGVPRGQRDGTLTAVILSFLDRSRYFSFK
jgi:hypothetical protein